MKDKIVIIGANSFQNKLILKARDLGYETHVFAWECGDVGEKTADYFYPISITEKEKILEECRKIKPAAVCSIASDLAVCTVNYVARALSLTANTQHCDYISTNKYEMRKALRDAGVATPQFMKVTEDNFKETMEMEFSYPVIVKPTDRSGSRAITKLYSKDGMNEAVKQAMEQSFESAAIIESYLEGKEYSCECISFRGKHHMLAITEKFTTGSPHYIETGHLEPAPLDSEVQDKVQEEVFRVLDALEIQYGASHTEFKINNNGDISVIEAGARMGGDCIGSDLVYLSTGNDFLKMVIDVACGKVPELVEKEPRQTAAVRFFLSTADKQAYDRIKDELTITDVALEGDMESPVVDSSSRYGYFIVTDKDDTKIRKQLFDKLGE